MKTTIIYYDYHITKSLVQDSSHSKYTLFVLPFHTVNMLRWV